MKNILKNLTFAALSILMLVVFASPKEASATFVYTTHSMPYVVLATPPPSITVSITANPATMTLPTNQTVLSWTTTGTPDSCSGFSSWSGIKTATGGSETMSGLAAGSYQYQIVCFKNGVTATDQVTVVVNNSQQNSITATLTPNPGTLPYGGGTSTLTWGSTNATSCTGGTFNTGGATAGSTQVSLTTTTTYTVTCIGGAGSAQAQATVLVLPQNVPINGVCTPTHFRCAAGRSTNNVTGVTAWTWDCAGIGGGTTASCSESTGATPPECSDGIDNADPEDTLIDQQDPGCHSDKDPNNAASYLPLKNSEKNGVKPIYIEL